MDSSTKAIAAFAIALALALYAAGRYLENVLRDGSVPEEEVGATESAQNQPAAIAAEIANGKWRSAIDALHRHNHKKAASLYAEGERAIAPYLSAAESVELGNGETLRQWKRRSADLFLIALRDEGSEMKMTTYEVLA